MERYSSMYSNEFTYALWKPFFDQLPWQSIERYRGAKAFKTCWMVSPDCQCVYRYGRQAVKPIPFDDVMCGLTHKISTLCGYDGKYFNSCNLNAYMEPFECVDWHADNEELFVQAPIMKTLNKRDVDIISLSMGGTRMMLFQKKYGSPACEVKLHDGDLCYMGGRLQEHYKHCIPKHDETTCGPFAPRVNFTWRVIRRHCKGCTKRAQN
jgi:alkylated DNA repair dioxygenase AlkB